MTTQTQTQTTNTVDAATSAVVFYDIESLDNLFSVVTLAVDPASTKAVLQVYYLIDDDDASGTHLSTYLADDTVRQRLQQRIMQSNPALLQLGYEITHVMFLDLHERENIRMLARLMAVTAEIAPHQAQAQHYTPGMGQEDYNTYQYVMENGVVQQRQYLCSDLAPVLCDTSPEYDSTQREAAFAAGYNSYNYDTTMLACFFAYAYAGHISDSGKRHRPGAVSYDYYRSTLVPTPQGNTHIKAINTRVLRPVVPPSAKYMRQINDALFAQDKSMPSFLYNGKLGMHPQQDNRTIAWIMRNNMLKSGRHIDVARFNEVQSKTGLKRHLAQLGHQLLESTKLDGHDSMITTTEELDELLVYNVADVVGLKLLFDHPLYSGSFNQRAALLNTYPECIYNQRADAYAPDIRPEAVDPWRLTIDSSSAQFVARVLAPYSQLDDLPAVSFNYPHPKVAEELGIEVFNVLDEAQKFFYATVDDDDARAQFDQVVEYYKRIEGKNFNPTLPGATPESTPLLPNIPKLPNNLPYFYADGTPSTGFATFSTGGIHGAEYFADRIEHDTAKANAVDERHRRILAAADNDPLRMKELKNITIINPTTGEEETIKRAQVLNGVTTDTPEWKPKITAITATTPELFKTINTTGPIDHQATQLNKRYAYTSIGDCIHEDFTSYYPLLLKNMRAFYNAELGEDRYSKIFDQKEYYGKLMKDPNTSAEDKATYQVLRNGAKLLLNSASGAGDAFHNTNIRMNNRIISMRIIGQLFLWRIGQAQTAAGATIISTNTDGLYSTKLSFERNNEVLAEQEQYIHVDIEPEPLTLVSKDSNNRVEFLPATSNDPHDRVVAAAGGALSCYNGPNPSKRLKDHAIVQYVLVEYFKQISLDDNPETRLREQLDRDVVREILHRAHIELPAETLLMFYQMIVQSSPGVGTYLYAVDYIDDDHDAVEHTEQYRLDDRNPHTIGKTNRIFIVDPNKARDAGSAVYNIGAIKATVIPEGKSRPTPDELVERLYAEVGADKDFLRQRKLSTGRYTSLDPASAVIVHNHSLHHPPQAALQPAQLLDMIDIDAYIDIIVQKYNADWRNIM